MNGRVGQMRCRYQVVGDRIAARAVSARLDRLATTQVTKAMAEALDHGLGDDPTVYVMRRVKSRVLLDRDRPGSDARLARAWGTRLARDVLKVLAANPSSSANIVRFADTAEYVGSFVAALLHGTAWDQWFYRRFSPVRGLGTVGALRAVLTDHSEHVPAIVQTVHRQGALERLLATSDDETLALLWRGVPDIVGPSDDRDAETARPVFLEVIRLIDHLDAWTHPRPDDTALWQAYLATRPLPTMWRDERDLSAAFLAILGLLHNRGHLRQPTDARQAHARLGTALQNLDWLDITTLRPAVERVLLGSPVTSPDDTRHDAESTRTVFLAIVNLIDHLDAWTDPRPDTTALCERYLAASSPPGLPRDPTTAFIDLIQRLHDGGHLQPADTELQSPTRVDAAVAEIEWLDSVRALPTIERFLGASEDAQPPGRETARRIFHAVVRLLDRLDAWSEPRPDITALRERYLATHPAPTTWRDPTAACLDILGLLHDRGHLEPLGREQASSRLDAFVGDLEGVDAATVVTSLEHLLEVTPATSQQLPVRDRGRRLTPRQRELLADLAALLDAGGLHNASGALDTTANAIRLHAALVAAAPRWQDDTMAKRMIERLLTSAQRVRNGDIHTRAVDEEQSAVVVTLAADESDVETIDTACAGVFLLVRAALDARLPALVKRVEYPPASDVLLALALRWAGPGGVVNDRIDRGLTVLGDIDSIAELRARWRTVPEERHADWIEALGLDDDVSRDADVLRDGRLDLPSVDAVVGMTALALLRRWAQWLRGFSSSSTPYLLDQFIRRPGRAERRADDLLVILEPRPLDVVLRLAGYLDPLDLTPLWGSGRLRLEVVDT